MPNKVQKFSETKWTMRYRGFKSIIKNLENLHNMFDKTLLEEKGLNSKVKA